ncbi:PKD domain-containing protein [Bacteroidota bacterium]
MKKSFLLIALAIILSFTLSKSYAYQFTVSGTITVLDSDELVPDHELYIYALDSTFYDYFLVTYTNEEGQYLFEIQIEDGINLDFIIQTASNCDFQYYYNAQVNSASVDTTVDFALCAPNANEDCYAMFYYYFMYDSAYWEGNTSNAIQFMDASFGDVIEWTWEFGDGTMSNEQNPLHLFEPGQDAYAVTLSILTSDDCANTFTAEVFINDTIWWPDECESYYYYEYLNETGEGYPFWITNIVQFYDISYGNVIEWNWDFGDGTTSSEQNPVHEFDVESNYYDVSLSILTSDSCSDVFNEIIYVSNEWSDCYADFYYYYDFDSLEWDNSVAFNKIQFIDMSYGENLNHFWNFGDGTSSSDQNPFHMYPNTEAIYNVTLDVFNDDSCFNTMEQLVYVYSDSIYQTEDCFADFWYGYELDSNDPTGFGFAENVIQFWDYSYGDITEWHWDFGDGTTSNEQNPIHVYPEEEGIYDVSLTINTSDTCTSTYTDVIYVYYWDWDPECQAMFFYFYDDSAYWENGIQIDFNNVQFYDYSYGDIMEWHWDFGDGTISYDQHPYHVYDGSAEEYWVSLTITTRDSCVSVAENIVYTGDWWEGDSTNVYISTTDTIFTDPVYTCAFDFDAGIDSVYIGSFEIIDDETVLVNWYFWQSGISFVLPINYEYIVEGITVVNLTIFCVEEKDTKGLRTITVSDVIDIKSGTASKETNLLKESISFYPNPVQDELIVEYQLEEKNNVLISILNTTGQEVLYQIVNSQSGNNEIVLDVNDLPEGVYVLILRVNDKFSTSHKFVK